MQNSALKAFQNSKKKCLSALTRVKKKQYILLEKIDKRKENDGLDDLLLNA